MRNKLAQSLVVAALFSSTAFGSPDLRAGEVTGPAGLTHCNWRDFGCNNPPPQVKPRAKVSNSAQANRSKLVCDPDLSSAGECWTDCKTDEDITICDIIQLDTFMPEAPGLDLPRFQLTGKVNRAGVLNKVYADGKKAKGRFVER